MGIIRYVLFKIETDPLVQNNENMQYYLKLDI